MPPPAVDVLILQLLRHGGASVPYGNFMAAQYWVKCADIWGQQYQASGGPGDPAWILSTQKLELQGPDRLCPMRAHARFLAGTFLPSSLAFFRKGIPTSHYSKPST